MRASSERGSLTGCAWEAAGREAATRGRDPVTTRPSLGSLESLGSAVSAVAAVAGVSTDAA
jgi:hypothetical protein